MIKRLVLEKKIMASNYYIPFIMLLFVVLYSVLLNRINNNFQSYLIVIYQMIIPVFSSWWVVFNLYDIVEAEGGEVVFTYKTSSLKLGLMNSLKYILLYICIVTITLYFVLKYFCIEDSNYFLLILLIQSLYYGSLAFFFMSTLKHSGWTFFLILAILSTIYFIGNKDYESIDIYYRGREVMPDREALYDILKKAISIIVISLTLGQYFISKNYKIFK